MSTEVAHCPQCGAPARAGAPACDVCRRPLTGGARAHRTQVLPGPGGGPEGVWATARALVAEYASLDQLQALLRSPRFWLLYSLAAMPVALQWMEIGAQGMFFYFSFFWAVVFHRLVAPERRTARLAVSVYLLTAFAVMPVLLVWLRVPPDLTTPLIADGAPVGARLVGFVGVGVREEVAKALPVAALLWMARRGGRRFSLRQGLFLGAVSGLAFAAVENLEYLRQFDELDAVRQAMGFHSRLTFEGGVSRLLLTPFMHGAWSGVAGYFLAWSELDTARRRALVLAGFALAALLHAVYNTVVPWPLLTLAAIGMTFHVLAKCIARATEEADVGLVPDRF